MAAQPLTPCHHRFKDITGQRYGRLVAIEPVDIRNGGYRWRFRCDCGSETVCAASSVKTGLTRSCGCLHRESAHINGKARKTHGQRYTPEYKIWGSLKTRCYNERSNTFQDYGAKGVTVCWRWMNSFENFLADMGRRPSPEHSIDRIDGTRGYEPGNCRWATDREQAQNRCTNRLITFRGETMPLIEWARRTGIRRDTIAYRLKRGWQVDRALTEPTSDG
jgi:hypothetical protein